LTSLEGKRGYPRNRPPRLTVRGLYQRPTVVNNVETLSNIVGHPRERRRRVQGGRHRQESRHASHLHLRPLEKPGVYEIEIGYPWRKFITRICGGAYRTVPRSSA
jgi:NADH-quinone oxidoreductase subunit F